MLLKAAGTLPPQTGAFCVFVCDRQRSERFLLLQPQQAEAALALLWSHSWGQSPRVSHHGCNCTSCLRQVTPTLSFSSLRQITHPQVSSPEASCSHSQISSLGQVPPTLSFPVPAGMLLNSSFQHCCGSIHPFQVHLESPAS